MTEDKQDQLIIESARILLPFIASLDPLWRDEIDVMRSERGFDELQTIGALVGYTLEQQAHMWIPQHPFFSDTHRPAGTRQACPQCGEGWIVAYPGQPVCSNACAIAFYAAKESSNVETTVERESQESSEKRLIQEAKEALNQPTQSEAPAKGRKARATSSLD